MITFKFNEMFSQDSPDTYSFKTYKEFFEFFIENHRKGYIFSIFDDGDTE